MSWIAVAVGAGAGLLKAEAVDAPKAERERTLAAQTQKYAYLTGNKAGPVHEADPLGSMVQFGATGASMRQNMQNADAQNKLAEAQTHWLNTGGSPSTSSNIAQSNNPSWRVTDTPWTF